jgi:hypothetical protein
LRSVLGFEVGDHRFHERVEVAEFESAYVRQGQTGEVTEQPGAENYAGCS